MTGKDIKTTAALDLWDIGFGVACVAFALLALLVWFPLDIVGSFVEPNQVGKIGPGDAFFPVLLASAILILGVIHLARLLISGRHPSGSFNIGRLSLSNLGFLAYFHLIAVLGLGLMYVAGPLTVTAMNALFGGEMSYRQLVDTAPYKYIGYVAGACLMTLPIITWTEQRLKVRSILVVLIVTTVIIVLFDGLLRNVQLPPNSDY
jgi:hypothetical protein